MVVAITQTLIYCRIPITNTASDGFYLPKNKNIHSNLKITLMKGLLDIAILERHVNTFLV